MYFIAFLLFFASFVDKGRKQKTKNNKKPKTTRTKTSKIIKHKHTSKKQATANKTNNKTTKRKKRKTNAQARIMKWEGAKSRLGFAQTEKPTFKE